MSIFVLNCLKNQYPAPSIHCCSILLPGLPLNPSGYQHGGAPPQSELSSSKEAAFFLFGFRWDKLKRLKRSGSVSKAAQESRALIFGSVFVQFSFSPS